MIIQKLDNKLDLYGGEGGYKFFIETNI